MPMEVKLDEARQNCCCTLTSPLVADIKIGAPSGVWLLFNGISIEWENEITVLLNQNFYLQFNMYTL